MLNSELENTFALSGHKCQLLQDFADKLSRSSNADEDTIHTTWFQAIVAILFRQYGPLVMAYFYLFIYLFISVEMFTLHTSNEVGIRDLSTKGDILFVCLLALPTKARRILCLDSL